MGRDFRINNIECCSALGSHPRHALDSPDAILPECSVSLSVGSVFPPAHFAKTPPVLQQGSQHSKSPFKKTMNTRYGYRTHYYHDDRREGMYFLVQEGEEVFIISGDFLTRARV